MRMTPDITIAARAAWERLSSRPVGMDTKMHEGVGFYGLSSEQQGLLGEMAIAVLDSIRQLDTTTAANVWKRLPPESFGIAVAAVLYVATA